MSSRVDPKSGCVADELSVDDVGESAFELSWSSPQPEKLFASVSRGLVDGV